MKVTLAWVEADEELRKIWLLVVNLKRWTCQGRA